MHKTGPFLSPMLNARLAHLSFSGPAGNDPQGGGGGSDPAGGSSGTGGSTPRVFTQEEVSRMAAAEKNQGERAGRAAALRDLGIDDPAEAKRLIDAARQQDQAHLTEAQRNARAAEDDRRAAAEDRAAAKTERVQATRIRLLSTAKAASPEQVVKMLSDLSADATEAETQTAVDGLKRDFPGLFVGAPVGADGDAGPTPTPTPPPGGGTGAGQQGKSWGERGRAAAAARRPQEQQTR